MLTDNTIIQRRDGYDVLAEHQAVPFHDGIGIDLHDVRRHGVDLTYHRGWQYKPAHWCVFDLRVVAPELAVDIPFTHARDRPGLIAYTLRARFPTAGDFKAQCLCNLAAHWLAVEHEQVLCNLPLASADVITFQPELRRATV